MSSRARFSAVIDRRSTLLPPVVVRSSGFAIGAGRIEIVASRIWSAGRKVDVVVSPGIFRDFPEELIPMARPRLARRLRHQSLESLLSRGQKTIDAFVKL